MNFIFRGDELLVAEHNGADLPGAQACGLLGLSPETMQRVWFDRDPHCRAAIVARDTEPPPGYGFRKLRSVLAELDDVGALACRAIQIVEWSRTHRHCGACGTPTLHSDTELCLRCPACNLSAYPRISPAMMVLIRRDDHILLARHVRYGGAARYTALAGFVEPGESIEQTVHREVREEVGLRVRNLRYFGSQPWPFPHSLMIAFTADYEDGDVRVQEDEISEALWFGPGSRLPAVPSLETIAGRLIRDNLPPGAVL